MGFFNKLFGNNRVSTLEDAELGSFTLLSENNKVIWQGAGKFLQSDIKIFISGTAVQLDNAERINVLDVLRNDASLEPAINEILKQEYDNAGLEYQEWSNHFECISISALNNETTIIFEERDSLYHFNVYIENGKAAGVSIDSLAACA